MSAVVQFVYGKMIPSNNMKMAEPHEETRGAFVMPGGTYAIS